MKDYIPLKVEFCLYENILCGRILQQDDRLIEQTNTEGTLIKEDDSLYHLSIFLTPGLSAYTLYLRGADKERDNEIFYYNYADKHYAEVALNNFKELIRQVNDCYNETDITEKKNTYYVEVCE